VNAEALSRNLISVFPLKISEKTEPKEARKRFPKGGTDSGLEETQSDQYPTKNKTKPKTQPKTNNDTENKRDESSSENINSGKPQPESLFTEGLQGIDKENNDNESISEEPSFDKIEQAYNLNANNIVEIRDSLARRSNIAIFVT